MKASLVILLSVAEAAFGGALLERQACNADNCLRAVRATAPTSRLPQASADCSSFLRRTVTPATVTETSSATTTTTTTLVTNGVLQTTYTIIGGGPTKRDALPEPSAALEARIASPDAPHLERRAANIPSPEKEGPVTVAARQVTVVPSAIPASASPCSGAVRYSSACSCFGVTGTTTTAPAPTTTVTTTFTSTASTTTTVKSTTTLGACAASDNYGIKYNGGYSANGPGQSGLSADFPSFPEITTAAGCCAKCFQSVGCLLFYLNGNTCNLYVESAGTTTYPPSDICPFGVASQFSNTNGDPYFGLGPCETYQGTP